MNPPKGIDPRVWEMALDVAEPINPGTILYDIIAEAAAKTISQAIEAEREECAKIADAYADVNWQECTDNILLDPVLSNHGRRQLTQADWDKSEEMAVGSTIHSSMYHAATNVAEAIRNRSNTTTERNEG